MASNLNNTCSNKEYLQEIIKSVFKLKIYLGFYILRFNTYQMQVTVLNDGVSGACGGDS